MHDGSRPAGYSGIERCGSIWACPHCAAVIRAGRAAEIEQAVKYHQETGGSVVFFTGTLRHHQGDQLEVTMDAILEGWRKLTAGRPWKRIKEKYQVSGYIRSIEVTYGGNGWHPHAHVLLFLDADINADQVEELRPTLYELWARAVERAGGKPPTERGLDLQKLDDDGKLLAKYLAKVQDEKQGWSVGAEMTRADVKQGRGGSITPFQLLDDHPDYDEQERARLWREFYQVSKGRRAITWSRGLKARCLIGEVTDADILDGAEATVMVWRTTSKAYRSVLRSEPVALALALELAEHEKWGDLAEILPRDDSPPDQRE
ncbi:TPA: protein rep [Staphylococcus aureus]|nr:protein rep [Staphylococcus aureus]